MLEIFYKVNLFIHLQVYDSLSTDRGIIIVYDLIGLS